ncbi:hypothetical protein EAX61_09955, partial [Dokdonia sinensis]
STATFVGSLDGADIDLIDNNVHYTYRMVLRNKIIITWWEKTQLGLVVGLPDRTGFHTMKIRNTEKYSKKRDCLLRQPLVFFALS